MRAAVLVALPLFAASCERPPAAPRTIEIGDAREPGDAGPLVVGEGEGEGEGEQPQPCRLIDLVLSLDDSGEGMLEEQAWAREVLYPSLGAVLWEVGWGLDGWRMAVSDGCPLPAGLHTTGASGDCGLHDGVRWVEGAWEDWQTHGQCILDVQPGANNCTGENDDEQPATTAARALNPPWVDELNAGFLRDDALLVVLAATDEDEQPVPEATAQQIHDGLVAAKGGDDRKVVFVGVGGLAGCDVGPYGPQAHAGNLQAVAAAFGARGLFLDACADLSDAHGPILELIDAACAAVNVD